MERRKVPIGTDSFWDLIITFGFESPYTLDTTKLTRIIRNEVVGRRMAPTINVKKQSRVGRYSVSFGHPSGYSVKDKIDEIMNILSAHEKKITLALELEAAKGLLATND